MERSAAIGWPYYDKNRVIYRWGKIFLRRIGVCRDVAAITVQRLRKSAMYRENEGSVQDVKLSSDAYGAGRKSRASSDGLMSKCRAELYKSFLVSQMHKLTDGRIGGGGISSGSSIQGFNCALGLTRFDVQTGM